MSNNLKNAGNVGCMKPEQAKKLHEVSTTIPAQEDEKEDGGCINVTINLI